MRTTIRLDDRLLVETKLLAARSGRTLSAVIEEALREMLARRQRGGKPRRRVKLTTIKGRGPLPGVDLDETAALLVRMEGRRAAS